MELKCPSCQAPVYTGKARVCGRCEEPLPPELLELANQHSTFLTERNWADEMPKAEEKSSTIEGALDPEYLAKLPPELLRDELPRDYSVEFANRPRPGLKLYLAGMVIVGAVVDRFIAAGAPEVEMPVVLAFVCIFVGNLYYAWRDSDPLCPNCHANIRRGRVEYCYSCGLKLRNQYCRQCGVDYSWLGKAVGFFDWNARMKLDAKIANCPTCGEFLDTRVRRAGVRQRY